MRCYVNNQFYLKATTVGASRIDLNGEPASVISTDEAEYAADKLKWVMRTTKKMNEKMQSGQLVK